MKRKRWLWLVVAIVILLATSAWIIWENHSPMLTKITVACANTPQELVGFRIAHISDFHNTDYPDDGQSMIEMIRNEQPHMIAITGDLIDSYNTNCERSLNFTRRLVEIAPVYYVTGNHEGRLEEEYPDFEKELIKQGVHVLRNRQELVKHNGYSFRIIGIDDPRNAADKSAEEEALLLHYISQFEVETAPFSLMLSHRPEGFDAYCDTKMDLVLTGHNHGGIIRIPFLGGIYAEGKLFPEHDSGLFTRDQTVMFVHRGSGNNSVTFRVNNRPEIVLLTLA